MLSVLCLCACAIEGGTSGSGAAPLATTSPGVVRGGGNPPLDSRLGGNLPLDLSVSLAAAWETLTPIPAEPRRYKRVLHAGDSLTGAMALALGKRFVAEGSGYHKDVWVGVSVATFDTERRFADQLLSHDPDLVLITLGANDIDSPEPDKIALHVRNIVRKVGGRDCYWIGPATWKEDTGVVDVIANNCAPCRFFDSRGLKLERKDGIHPTIKGGQAWADRFWDYFERARSVVSP